ncbi:biotin transporter BioY [Streptomyces albofaciens JCM 4342]|uniref:ATP-binding protein n=1 Tax=Streptomyces albofaciens TaxID=66866 RepID=UPI00123B1116|nr:ATP-binding protein [Streptomyces albofaciens]KAA6213392.1 biotin transporter BioY [Streptomyces albofaciens JCM 4342]
MDTESVRPAVTELRLSAFKSHRGATVPLGPLTLLTGPSGSGKSSVLQAYDILARLGSGARLGWAVEAAPGGAVGCVPAWARPDEQGRRGFRIGCTVEGPVGPVRLDVAVQAEPELRIVGERLTGGGETLLSTALTDPARRAVQAAWYTAGSTPVTRAPLPDDRLGTALLPLRVAGKTAGQRLVLAAAEQVVVALRSVFACDPRPEAMRGAGPGAGGSVSAGGGAEAGAAGGGGSGGAKGSGTGGGGGAGARAGGSRTAGGRGCSRTGSGGAGGPGAAGVAGGGTGTGARADGALSGGFAVAAGGDGAADDGGASQGSWGWSAGDGRLRTACDNLPAVLGRTSRECARRHAVLVEAVRDGCAGPVEGLRAEPVELAGKVGIRALVERGSLPAMPLEQLGDGELRYVALALVLLTGPEVLAMDPVGEVLSARQVLGLMADGMDRSLDGRQTRALLELAVRMVARGHVRLLGTVRDAAVADGLPGVQVLHLGV